MRYKADITVGALKLPESRLIADLLLRQVDAEGWKDAALLHERPSAGGAVWPALLVSAGATPQGCSRRFIPRIKTKYRVANWPAYNQALVRRGDVMVWVSSEAIAAWTPRRSGRRGGQRRYSDLAIETAMTLRLLSHLPLRQAEGFLHALFRMMRLDLSVPDYTTLSRRSQHLTRRLRPVPLGEGLHLVLDSTGLSIRRGRGVGGRDTRWPRQTWLAEAPPWRRSVRRDPCSHTDRGDGG